ncbi:tannase/feruloyl esterase family alpha/beta hydrolase [Cohaesibacter haloalkalitolerans]|uniref:tannase/feruloyl esterase family alpha/beta hydrolase n=1 Tax=Cohaesibacter haloalkalitolerans TaxID=1162980 RepID=UPI000E64A2EB|nr:tannase/feruloyl esterase family alpha/beta hydrolase [Cohaesibacter haloalkalitolerans]
MPVRFLGLSLLLMSGTALPSMARADDMANKCEALAGVAIRNVRIDTASLQQAGELPADPNSAMTGGSPRALAVSTHCLVEGKIEDRAGVGGQYGIRFQFRAPVDWNGRFLFQGGGGMDGFIAPAIGSVPVNTTTATPALARGYAVISMDGGHNGYDAAFAQDQQARLDLGFAAIGKVTNVAKDLIDEFYGRQPDQSVFMGCSNGGREALMAAQRFPLEFDGVVAGNPGFHLSHAPLAELWDVKQLMAIAPEVNGEKILAKALTQDDLDLVSRAVLDACDDQDGLKDGLINAYKSCKFDLESLRGTLEDKKLDALKRVMAGPVDAGGNSVYSDWPVDAGINAAGWRAWKLGTSENGQSNALNVVLGLASFSQLFMTPPTPSVDLATLDFGKAEQAVREVGGYFDANSTFMTTYANHGGKLLVFHGMSDPVFSASDLMTWYEKAEANTGDTEFSRLFMVPGMTHCGGGPAMDDFDPLTVMEKWMDSNKAPEQMAATGKSFEGTTQPICAYPKEAHYKGGDKTSIDSYSCQ